MLKRKNPKMKKSQRVTTSCKNFSWDNLGYLYIWYNKIWHQSLAYEISPLWPGDQWYLFVPPPFPLFFKWKIFGCEARNLLTPIFFKMKFWKNPPKPRIILHHTVVTQRKIFDPEYFRYKTFFALLTTLYVLLQVLLHLFYADFEREQNLLAFIARISPSLH